ncbi:MAG TPA: hypothetical protein VLY63_15285 [Anaerolineae bacterium]|nr:hypothetical protein [Anaerolineae bacterium]
MFRTLRVRRQPKKHATELGALSADWLAKNPNNPVTLRQINGLPENAKKRILRALLPPSLLGRFRINPVTWQGPDGDAHVLLTAKPETSVTSITVRKRATSTDEFFYIELEDTSINGINLNFLLIRDPDGPCFRTDRDDEGNPTLFGTVRRNLAAEEQAMKAGLAPGQVCTGLRASQQALQHLEAFLVTIGHTACFLEPLTYASAWLFERRGFAYVRGHKLMDEIDQEFLPGGRLHQALDGSTPFRQPDQWRTVRGRAWAIHDNILEATGATWDGLRMIKQVGRHAGVETFHGAAY